jgi:thioredoxin-like negative regulator of GroEL
MTARSTIQLVIAKADWSEHWRTFRPVVDRLQKNSPLRLTNGNLAQVVILDADKHAAEINKLGIQGFPAVVIVHDGQVHEYVGERSYENILTFLNQYS